MLFSTIKFWRHLNVTNSLLSLTCILQCYLLGRHTYGANVWALELGRLTYVGLYYTSDFYYPAVFKQVICTFEPISPSKIARLLYNMVVNTSIAPGTMLYSVTFRDDLLLLSSSHLAGSCLLNLTVWKRIQATSIVGFQNAGCSQLGLKSTQRCNKYYFIWRERNGILKNQSTSWVVRIGLFH